MITKEQHQRNVDFIASLRAGCWKQSIGGLRVSEDCYCAEGAACDFSCLGEWKLNDSKFYYVVGIYHSRMTMPREVVEFFGWLHGFRVPGYGDCSLFSINDGLEKNFIEIADIIERWLNAQAVES